MDGQKPATSEIKAIPGLIEGRIVHYVKPSPPKGSPFIEDRQCYAAIVSRVHDKDQGLVDLHVFFADGIPVYNVSHAAAAEPGHWHWIERA